MTLHPLTVESIVRNRPNCGCDDPGVMPRPPARAFVCLYHQGFDVGIETLIAKQSPEPVECPECGRLLGTSDGMTACDHCGPIYTEAQ